MNVSYLAGTKLALTCGYLGTALMVLSMAYLLQRRFGWFYRTATNQFWLDVHLMTGTVGPLFIVLHSALRLTTWVSIPFWSMVAVVISGVLGRYLYTLVPSLTSKHDLAILAHRRAITELAMDHPAAGDHAYQVMDREARRSEAAWQIGLAAAARLGARRRPAPDVDPAPRPPRPARASPRARSPAGSPAGSTGSSCYERRKELAPRGKALLRSWKRVHIPFSIVAAGDHARAHRDRAAPVVTRQPHRRALASRSEPEDKMQSYDNAHRPGLHQGTDRPAAGSFANERASGRGTPSSSWTATTRT